MSRGKAAIGPDGGQRIPDRVFPHKPSLSTLFSHPAKSPARDPSQTFSPPTCTTKSDSTIQLRDPARPDAARRCSPARFLQRAALEDAGLHEADKPDIQRDLMGTEVDTVRVMA
jgi:hypothetical protein